MASPTAALVRIAALASAGALLIFAAGTWAPAEWRDTAVTERPIAWLLLAAAAVLMGLARRGAAQPDAPRPPRREPRWSLPPLELPTAPPTSELTLIEQAMLRSDEPVVAAAPALVAAQPVSGSPAPSRLRAPLWTLAALACGTVAWLVVPRAPTRVPARDAHVARAAPPLAPPVPAPQEVAAADLPALPAVAAPSRETASTRLDRLASLPVTTPRPPTPHAGRQVMRCIAQGRVTYTDAEASCAEGSVEHITVFPTRGVGPMR